MGKSQTIYRGSMEERLEIEGWDETKIVVKVNDKYVDITTYEKDQVDGCGIILYHSEWRRVKNFVEDAINKIVMKMRDG